MKISLKAATGRVLSLKLQSTTQLSYFGPMDQLQQTLDEAAEILRNLPDLDVEEAEKKRQARLGKGKGEPNNWMAPRPKVHACARKLPRPPPGLPPAWLLPPMQPPPGLQQQSWPPWPPWPWQLPIPGPPLSEAASSSARNTPVWLPTGGHARVECPSTSYSYSSSSISEEGQATTPNAAPPRSRQIAPPKKRTQSQPVRKKQKPVPDKRARTTSTADARSSVDAFDSLWTRPTVAVDNRTHKATVAPAAPQRRTRRDRSRGCSPDRRFGRGQRVMLMTCGYNQLKVANPDKIDQSKETMSAWQDDLQCAIRHATKVNVVVDLFFSFLDVYTPNGDDYLRTHCGENAEMMGEMIHNPTTRPQFKWHLWRLQAFIKQFIDEFPDHKDITIALVCRSGRHRSVCVAAFLEFCLLFEGFDCNTVHINDEGWKQLCTTCRLCGACPEIKNGLYDDVLAMWRDC